MAKKNVLRALCVALGIAIALPVWGLSGMVFWAVSVGITTMIFLDIVLIRQFPVKMKLACIVLYTLTMIGVVILLLTM